MSAEHLLPRTKKAGFSDPEAGSERSSESDHDNDSASDGSDAISQQGNAWQNSLLATGALMLVWIIGIMSLIALLEKFKTALQPLVLAMVLVSVLEKAVQWFEAWVHAFVQLIKWLMRKVYVLARMAATRLCRSAKGENFDTNCSCLKRHELVDRKELVDMAHFPFQWWPKESKIKFGVVPKWHPNWAGRDTIARTIAVILTLIIVVFVAGAIFARVGAALAEVGEKIGDYEKHMVDIITYSSKHIVDLADKVPGLSEDQRDKLRVWLQEKTKGAGHNTATLDSMKGDVLNFVTTFLSSTSSFVSALLFFILYVSLVLFDPLHLNEDEEISEMYEKSNILFKSYDGQDNTQSSTPPKQKTEKSGASSVGLTARKSLAILTGTATLAPVKKTGRGSDEWLKKHDEEHKKAEVQEHLYNIMWQYVRLKVACNALYSGCVTALLSSCHVDMAILLGLSGFFLSFIPELGAIISIVLPFPILLLQPTFPSEHPNTPGEPFNDWSNRSAAIGQVFLGMLAIKFIVGNVVESVVMSKSKVLSGAVEEGVEVKETHPVIILFAVVIAGEIWGVVGMLISVPFISIIRVAVNVWSLEEEHHEGGGSEGLSRRSLWG